MKKITIFVSVLLLATSAVAQKFTSATVPMFSQKLSFQIPTGWKGTPQGNRNVFMLEIVPATETLDSWTQMLTVEGYANMASQQKLEDAVAIELDSVKKACPATFIFSPIATESIQGYESISAIAGCGKNPAVKDHNEVALYNFIKGKADIYMIKKSFRESLSDKKTAHLSKANYKDLASEVLAVKICKNDGASPSCTLENK